MHKYPVQPRKAQIDLARDKHLPSHLARGSFEEAHELWLSRGGVLRKVANEHERIHQGHPLSLGKDLTPANPPTSGVKSHECSVSVLQAHVAYHLEFRVGEPLPFRKWNVPNGLAVGDPQGLKRMGRTRQLANNHLFF
jgi:hypothetical protein